jgi:hypothetical protein
VLAARAGDADRVTALLAGGADPTVRGRGGRRAYDAAATKEVRLAFRRAAAAAPDAFDWADAGVPSPLTPEMEAAQEARSTAKKAKARLAEKERKAAAAAKKAAAKKAALAADVEAIDRAAREAAEMSLRPRPDPVAEKRAARAAEEAAERRARAAAAAEARLKAAAEAQRLW